MSFTVWQNDYGKDGEKPSWISTKTSFHPGFWRQSLQFVSFCGKASGSIHIGAIWLCNVCPAGYTRTLIFYVLTIQFFTPAEQLRDKYDITKHPNYKYLSDFDKKNAFDVERYMSTRPAIVKPDEAFDIYEIDLSDEDAAAEE